MSCCTPKKQKSSSSKEFDILKNNFDIATVEDFEKYQLLTLADKAPSGKKYDICWFELKIAKQASNENYESNNGSNYLDKICNVINDWFPILKNPLQERQVEYNLFGEVEDDSFKEEPMPEQPTTDGDWNKYWNEYHRISKNNLKKEYTFLELFDIDFYLYKEIDWRNFLPSVEEVREMYKVRIKKHKHNPGRFDDFWWDTPSYLTRDEGLSDIELRDRLKSIRIHLVPYIDYFQANYDMLYTNHSRGDKEDIHRYRFYIDGTKISENWSSPYENRGKDDKRYENLFNSGFLDWVREELNIPYKEAISDEDILKENLKYYFSSLLWYKEEEYNLLEKINTFKNWKQFKADIQSFIKQEGIDTNGGGSGFSQDGFNASVYKNKKGSIVIRQPIKLREEFNRNIDNLELDDRYDDNVLVWNISGDEIFKKAFELLNEKSNKVKQSSLFDFLDLAA